MKVLFVIMLFSVAGSLAQACPNLTGNWTCKSQDEINKLKLNSINREDMNLLVITADEGSKVATTDTLLLNVGKQKGKDYDYRALCQSNSVIMDLETVFGPSKTAYTLLSPNQLLISVYPSDSSDGKVMTCSKVDFSRVD